MEDLRHTLQQVSLSRIKKYALMVLTTVTLMYCQSSKSDENVGKCLPEAQYKHTGLFGKVYASANSCDEFHTKASGQLNSNSSFDSLAVNNATLVLYEKGAFPARPNQFGITGFVRDNLDFNSGDVNKICIDSLPVFVDSVNKPDVILHINNINSYQRNSH